MASTLEPKVAKLETALESVTRDTLHLTQAVDQLSAAVSTLAKSTSDQFSRLMVDLTAAAAPKRIEYQVWIAAGILVLAVGAAVLGPVLQRVEHTHAQLEALANQFSRHEKLPLHAVGESRVNELEKMLMERTSDLTKELDIVRTQGTPITSSRIGVLESKVEEIERRINVLHPLHLHHPGDENGTPP